MKDVWLPVQITQDTGFVMCQKCEQVEVRTLQKMPLLEQLKSL